MRLTSMHIAYDFTTNIDSEKVPNHITVRTGQVEFVRILIKHEGKDEPRWNIHGINSDPCEFTAKTNILSQN
jgi:hypothetical protein